MDSGGVILSVEFGETENLIKTENAGRSGLWSAPQVPACVFTIPVLFLSILTYHPRLESCTTTTICLSIIHFFIIQSICS
jgi:hypothetical protein